ATSSTWPTSPAILARRRALGGLARGDQSTKRNACKVGKQRDIGTDPATLRARAGGGAVSVVAARPEKDTSDTRKVKKRPPKQRNQRGPTPWPRDGGSAAVDTRGGRNTRRPCQEVPMKSILRGLGLATLLAVGLFASGCGDDNNVTTPTPSP